MPFAALDLHKREFEAVIIDDNGQRLFSGRLPCTREALQSFAQQHLSLQHRIVVEATFNTWPVAALLEPYVAEVVISNPVRTRAIAEAKIKTDRVDANVLAQLLRLDYLPRVWQPDPATRRLRSATTERAALVADRTRVKNRIHAVLHQRLIPSPEGDLFRPANLHWLETLAIDPPGRESLGRHLRQLALIESEIKTMDDEAAQRAFHSPQIKLLMTLPGVDFTVAETLLAAYGDITRFPDPDKASSYLGLVPSTYQSGDRCYHGRITKQGRSHARWLLVEAAQHLDRHPGPLGVFFRRIARKKNRNVAVVAVARKLVVIAWHMLRNNEPYRYAQPKTVEAKFTRLRIRAGGARKKGGVVKGSPRPSTYGTGRTRLIPALDSIYEDNHLPPLSAFRPGERAMLESTDVTDYAWSIRQSQRIRCKTGEAASTSSTVP